MDKLPDNKKSYFGTGLFRLLMRRHGAEDGGSSSEVVSMSGRGGSSGSSQANASSLNNVGTLTSLSEDYVRDSSSFLNLQPCFYKRGSSDGNEKVESLDNDYGIDDAGMSPRSVSVGRRLERNQSSLRNRRSRRSNLKPLASSQNCLIPSLYNEQFEIEDHILTPVSSPRGTNLRHFLVKDGKKGLNKTRYSSPMPLEGGPTEKVGDLSLREMQTVIGIPPLPELRDSKRKKQELHSRNEDNSNIIRKDSHCHSQVSLSGVLLFFLGLRIGMISTSSFDRKEVEKLTDLLQHTESLVQDLQEELEMKNSFSVKELANDEYDSSGLIRSLPNMKECAASKPMSNMEAELEVELEILVQNMSFGSRENNVPSLSALDPDLEAEVVHGDLRADTLEPKSQNYLDRKKSSSKSTSTTQANVNYAVDYVVCPKELRLRLYQVVESRLQERIRELEDALFQSQKQIQSIESEQTYSQRTLSTSDLGSSSNHGSPVVLERAYSSDHPMFVNLSGDALGAYNEFYEELMEISDMQEEKTPLPMLNQSLIWGPEEGDDDLKKSSTNTNVLKRLQSWEQILRSNESEDTDDDSSEDKEGKMLIQQMVEQKRHRSPAFVHAQKMLFLMDD